MAAEDRWIREARSAMRESDVDFFKTRPARYWLDLATSVAIAYTAATCYMAAPVFSWVQIVAYPVTVFWLYRLGSLVHEVAHLPRKEMRSFKLAWNLLAGVPLLTPSPFYTAHHRDHHSLRLFGTREDPEYIVRVCKPGSWPSFLAYVVLVLVFPLLVFLRFLLTPLTFLHPKLRTFVLERASSLMMNHRYGRRVSRADRTSITAIELLCWGRATLIPAAALLGWTPWSHLPLLYVLGASTLVFNQLRLLADHHYESNGSKLRFAEHVLDSCNYTGRDLLTWLFFPFSIRYHALHHLFPTLPYHNLSAAHGYLLESLPADSPYRSLDQPGWWSVARHTLRSRDVHEQCS
jgi:fatty acid desaturase